LVSLVLYVGALIAAEITHRSIVKHQIDSPVPGLNTADA